MSLRNMNIAPRALLGFSLIGALMLALGIFALNQMGQIRKAGESIEQISVPSITNLDQLTQLTLRLRTLSYRLLLNREAETQQNTMQLLAQRNAQIDEARRAYEPLIEGTEERSAYNQYVQLLTQYRQLESQMESLSQRNEIEALRNLINRELLDNSEQINAVTDRLVKINTDQTRLTNQMAATQYDTAWLPYWSLCT